MFVKNVMSVTKPLVDTLQAEQLDVSGAQHVIRSTLDTLQGIRSKTQDQENLIEAALQFSNKMSINGKEEYERLHRPRKPPKRLDSCPETAAVLSMTSFYCKEMNTLLDTMISVLTDKFSHLKQTFQVFSDVLQINSIDLDSSSFPAAVASLAAKFPREIPDQPSFIAELQIFKRYYAKHLKDHPDSQDNIRSAADCALQAHHKFKLFGMVSKVYRLLLTAPPSVCKSERTFSRLKLLKTYLRSTMSQKRLHNLMILSCEKETTDNLDLKELVEKWSKSRSRRIALPTQL